MYHSACHVLHALPQVFLLTTLVTSSLPESTVCLLWRWSQERMVEEPSSTPIRSVPALLVDSSCLGLSFTPKNYLHCLIYYTCSYMVIKKPRKTDYKKNRIFRRLPMLIFPATFLSSSVFWYVSGRGVKVHRRLRPQSRIRRSHDSVQAA